MPATARQPLTWDLDVLLPNPATPEFQRLVDAFKRDLDALVARAESLPAVAAAGAAQTWAKFLGDYQELEARAGDFNAFIGCHAAGDARNKCYQQWEASLSALDPARQRIATNIEFAFQAATPEAFEKFITADAELTRLRYFLESARENARFRLPKEQELLSADLGVDGIHAWGRLYDRLSGELRVKLMEKGEIVEKSPGQVRFDMADRTVRENNFYAADKAWASIADTCADALNHIAGTRLTIYRRLGLRDHLDAPLHYNRMRRETLDAMWGAVSARKGTLLKFFEKKAQALGVPQLAWFDVLAPYPTDSQAGKELPYDDACDQVFTTFDGFSPEFGDFAKMAIRDRWVEVENRGGKRQGGFCTDLPGRRQSRIFMTYKNTADDMSTLAHELGHAYHTFVLRDQPLLLQSYPMNLAETASTFAEAVLGEQRLRRAETKSEKLSILDGMLGDAVAFLMNIHCRFIFEHNFHQERPAGEVSSTRLCELMEAAQKEAYLGGLSADGCNPRFWVSKLHFYISGLPFYNFPYTFGYLLSLGLYAVAREGSDNFPERYRQLLIATGCMDAEEAVASTFGYDLSKPDFWNKSLDVVDQRIGQFLELAE